MKYGFVLPYGDAGTAAELAYVAEQSGWDGFFVWEPVWGIDAWVSLTAAAMRTERIRLGTMVTPVSRRRPWKLAGETATLDRLSNGRLILSVGLGALDSGFEAFGEVTDRKTRAELLDEGLDILTGLWRGEPFNYKGKHYRIKETDFFPPPPPLQQPRVPIWVVGAWPRRRSMERALRYDGLLPSVIGDVGGARSATVEELREISGFVDAKRGPGGSFDIVVEGQTPGHEPHEAAAIVGPWASAGATWWIEAMWDAVGSDPKDAEAVERRLRQGPPGL